MGRFITLTDAIPATDNGLLVGIQEEYYDGSIDFNRYAFLMKIDSLGNVKWEKPMPEVVADSNGSGGILLKALPDGNFLVCYNSQFRLHNGIGYNEDSMMVQMMKVDSAGNILWHKSLSNDFNSFFGYNTIDNYNLGWYDLADNKLLLVFNNSAKGWLVKMDYDGNVDWIRKVNADPSAIGCYADNKIYDLDLASDSSFYLCGTIMIDPLCGMNTDSTPYQNAWLMHLDKYGCLEPGCQLTDGINKIEMKSEVLVYPNPTTDEINITTGGVFSDGKQMTISIVTMLVK